MCGHAKFISDIQNVHVLQNYRAIQFMISINHFRLSIIYSRTSYNQSCTSINRIMNILKISIFLDILKSNLIWISENQIMDIRNSGRFLDIQISINVFQNITLSFKDIHN